MSRLTKKIENPQYMNDYDLICNHNYTAINKLGQLEDLEDELGCPLEVLIKLTKQEKVNFKGQMVEYYVFYNTLRNRYEIRNEDTMDLIPLNQYKISWWLREDKSE